MTTACYLCDSTRFTVEAERVRDRNDVQVLACRECGLLFLSSFDHITPGFYEDSRMHAVLDIEAWMSQTAMDDERRYQDLKVLMARRRVLDVGCGNGGFLIRAQQVAGFVRGVDPDQALVPHFQALSLPLAPALDDMEGQFDVITLFHVLEHVPDPRRFLRDVAERLAPGGQVFIEVPNADDALLSLYNCEAFKAFTYWSCHLFSFSAATLRMVFDQVRATVLYIKHIQRYPLSNHLYWLRHGKPEGHQVWSLLDAPALAGAYAAQLTALGKTDTLFASIAFPG